MMTLAGHKEVVVGAKWLPTSKKDIVTASWDHTLLIWDVELAGIIFYLELSSYYAQLCVAEKYGQLV